MADENKNYLIKRETEASAWPQMQNCLVYFTRLFFEKILNCEFWIAGGAVRDYFLQGYTDSDIDFYAATRTDLCKLILALRRDFKFKHYLITANAIKGSGYLGTKKIDIDIVKVLFADPVATIDAFDFTICCFAVDKNRVYFHPSAPFDLLRKRLVVNSLPFPVSTMQRMQKFIKRDYWICNGGMLEIAKAIGTVNWTDPTQNPIEMYPDGSPRFVRID